MIKPYDPAFPTENVFPATAGLTKREIFAAMAMQGMVANSKNSNTIPEDAEVSVRIADALLAELAKGGKDD